ncbi:hypothetical protein WOLCODRAFT_68561, partial [Wolfiporia cocos MD-104 SS10]
LTAKSTLPAVSCYDYLLTLDREIKFIWKADLSFATFLFYSYRYPILLNAVLEILGRVTWGWQSAEVQVRVFNVVQFQCTQLKAEKSRPAVVSFNGHRWVWIGSRKWLFVVYVFIRTSPRQNGIDGFWSCTLIILGPHGSYEDYPSLQTVVMGARAASLLSDGIVLVLTCMKTARRGAMRKMMLGDREPTLGDILLKDSTYRSRFLCIINVFALAAGRDPLVSFAISHTTCRTY